jgi:hypothetical protein
VLDNVAVDIHPVEYNEQKVEPQLDVVLTLDMFKQQWSTVPIAGAFQTRLKEMPARDVVVHHLENQGTYSLTHSLTHLLNYSLTHLLTQSLTYSFTYLLTYLQDFI